MPHSERNGAERLLDLAVYAPLGFALEIRRMFPDLAERGRRQVTFTRTVGKAAVTRGGLELRRRLRTETESPREDEAVPVRDDHAEFVGSRPSPQPAPVHLAITDYESLSAQHVVKRLDGLTPVELEAIRSYEESNRGRRTILTRIAQLQG